MRKIGLGALAILLSGCGNNLASINVSPAIAHAKAAGAKIQFAATATYDGSSTPKPLPNAQWCIGNAMGGCNGFIDPGATIDDHGLATCSSDHPVTITVLAGRGVQMVGSPDQGYNFEQFGTATLICP